MKAWLAVLVLMVVACGGSTASPSLAPTTAPASASASPTQTTTPPPSPSIGDLWARAAEPIGPLYSAATAVAAGGPGFVAVGLDGTSGAIVWTSPDGRTWTTLSSPSFAGAGMSDVVAFEGGFVAVGRVIDSPDGDGAAAWISPDGASWERVDGGASFESAQLVSVTHGGPGLVAVGGIPGADLARIWTSSDGRSWAPIPDDPAFEHAFLWRVAPGGPGLVAVGWRRDPEPAAAVWTSADGVAWTLVPPIPGREAKQIRSVVSTPAGLVAGGKSVTGGEAAIWVSADGSRWDAVESASFAGAAINELVVAGDRVVAVGSRAPDDAAVWTSADGRTWTLLEDEVFEDAYLTAVAASENGSRLVAVGAAQQRIPGTSGSYDQWASAWVSPAR